jgi:hypothetical protein
MATAAISPLATPVFFAKPVIVLLPLYSCLPKAKV